MASFPQGFFRDKARAERDRVSLNDSEVLSQTMIQVSLESRTKGDLSRLFFLSKQTGFSLTSFRATLIVRKEQSEKNNHRLHFPSPQALFNSFAIKLCPSPTKPKLTTSCMLPNPMDPFQASPNWAFQQSLTFHTIGHSLLFEILPSLDLHLYKESDNDTPFVFFLPPSLLLLSPLCVCVCARARGPAFFRAGHVA